MAAQPIEFSGDDSSLTEAIYIELRRLASYFLNSERRGHTLRPTEIVHEAWLRLAVADQRLLSDRAYFLASASLIMRHILVDHARSRSAMRNGGDLRRVDFDYVSLFTDDNVEAVLIVDEALTRLAKWDQRTAKIVELRFFMGLTELEVSEVLGISERTVKRDWQVAKTWLRTELDRRQRSATAGEQNFPPQPPVR